MRLNNLQVKNVIKYEIYVHIKIEKKLRYINILYENYEKLFNMGLIKLYDFF